jgi:pyrroloquinoline quinone (PQQ) biosynthesis protein C
MSKISMDLTPISEAVASFPWDKKVAYAEFIAQTYYYVRHSTRLLALAAGMIEPGNRKAFDRFIKHIGEERNHELLARRDMEGLGFNLDEMSEMPVTRLLWEPQYYKVIHQSPMALMGYILPLEALAANEGGKVVQVLEQTYGSKCLHFLRLHGEEDIKHVKDAIALTESLGESDLLLVQENIEQTVLAYSLFLKEIAKKAS